MAGMRTPDVSYGGEYRSCAGVIRRLSGTTYSRLQTSRFRPHALTKRATLGDTKNGPLSWFLFGPNSLPKCSWGRECRECGRFPRMHQGNGWEALSRWFPLFRVISPSRARSGSIGETSFCFYVPSVSSSPSCAAYQPCKICKMVATCPEHYL